MPTDKLKLEVADGIGRQLVADRFYQQGATLLTEEPVAAVLYDSARLQRCGWSFQPCSNLLRCSGCKVEYFANRQHQKLAWQAGHKQECAGLSKMQPKMPPPTLRLAARILWHVHR